MPYVKQERRDALNKVKLIDLGKNVAGVEEINYVIMKLVCDYLLAIPEEYGYDELNEIIGTLEWVKQKFYRNIIIPYEEGGEL